MHDRNSIPTTERPKLSRQRPPEWIRLRELLAEDCSGSVKSRVFGGATKEQLCLILRAKPLPAVFRRDEESWQHVLEHEYEAFGDLILESQEDDLKSVFPHDGKRAGKHIESEIHGAMPTLLAWFHTKLIDTSLEMSMQSRAGGSLVNFLRLPSCIIETELFDWVRFHIRARALTPEDDKLEHVFADLPDSSCSSIVPYILIGALCLNTDDTAAEAIDRLKDCFEDVCANRFRMLKDRNVPRSWVERATCCLKTIDSMYVIYLESLIARVALANRNVRINKTGGASPTKTASIRKQPSPTKQELSSVSSSATTSINRRAPMSRTGLDKNLSPMNAPSSHIPVPSPTRISNDAARTPITPALSTPLDGRFSLESTNPSFPPPSHRLDEGLFLALTRAEEQHKMKQQIADAQAKTEERVCGRHPGSQHMAASVRTSEIKPGIVRSRQVTYGSPVKKPGGVTGKPA